jgi:hypothetical protein
MIVTYNLCFSTILGRIQGRGGGREGGLEGGRGGRTRTTGRLGVIDYPQERSAKRLSAFLRAGREGGRKGGRKGGREEGGDGDGMGNTPQACFVAPSGAIFVPARERQGVLPRMLHEILQTRFMVKKGGKGGREGGREGGRAGRRKGGKRSVRPLQNGCPARKDEVM